MNEYINSNGYVKMNMNMNMDMDMENDAIAVSLGVGSKKPDLCVVLCVVFWSNRSMLPASMLCYLCPQLLQNCYRSLSLTSVNLCHFIFLFFCDLLKAKLFPLL